MTSEISPASNEQIGVFVDELIAGASRPFGSDRPSGYFFAYDISADATTVDEVVEWNKNFGIKVEESARSLTYWFNDLAILYGDLGISYRLRDAFVVRASGAINAGSGVQNV